MDVNTIRERILEISHNEDAPDTDLRNKAMRWLNSAYHEMVDELRPYLARYLETSEALTADSAGVATLSANVYRVVTVTDKTNGRNLKEITRAECLKLDPKQTKTGAPNSFWLDGDELHLYPRSAVDLSVVYMPTVSELVDGGAESSILLPTQFHHALVWGGLVWSAIFERGFATQGELLLFQNKWDEARRQAKLSLASKPTGALRVQAFEPLENI